MAGLSKPVAPRGGTDITKMWIHDGGLYNDMNSTCLHNLLQKQNSRRIPKGVE